MAERSGPGTPGDALERYVAAHPSLTRCCVAYSGGRDSHVLLHLAVQCLRDRRDIALRAVHIDHGLTSDSARWAAHCQAVCERLGVPLQVSRIEVLEQGRGPEAAARVARYAAFAQGIGAGEHLLLAQHADDQAETFLLQALRGSGPHGLAAMPAQRPFGTGVMARPLIECGAEAIAACAARHRLAWIEDPSNASQRFDRNFLRHEILPRLRERWPAAVRTLGRSAQRSGAAARMLDEVADQDLRALRLPDGTELSVSGLARLPRERGFNAVRRWVRRTGYRVPRLQDLRSVHEQLVLARADSRARLRIDDYQFRRHGDRLYLLPLIAEAAPFEHRWHAPYAPLLIPEIGLRITREEWAAQGLCLPRDARLSVRSRNGGERIGMGPPGAAPAFHRTLKNLWQQAAVPPWERDRIPLLFVDETLAAVWRIAVSSQFQHPRPGASPDGGGLSSPGRFW